jgi:3-hydroxybutyryl-CoA dehydrogenase
MDHIERLAVIGAGQMGAGIAQVAAQSKLSVLLYDSFDGALERAAKGITKSLSKLEAKGRLPDGETAASVQARITPCATLEELRTADFAIEAIIENEAIKRDIFSRLDDLLEPGAILASNTSSIPITRLCAATNRPDRVVGMHFMNPVPVMKLVECIRGLPTSDETFTTTVALAEKMGKTTCESQDYPGFIVNRVLIPFINEACYAVMEGVASPADVDKSCQLGLNHPMGPLTLADFIGLDTVLAIAEVLHSGLGDAKYRPCPLLRNYVDAGWLGRKTGRGFYTYG